MLKGTLAPPEREQSLYALFPWLPTWLDLNIVVPAAATVVVVLVGIIVICVAWSRRHPHGQTRLRGLLLYNLYLYIFLISELIGEVPGEMEKFQNYGIYGGVCFPL